MIVAVALLGRENGPLYLRAFGDHANDDLRFHFIAHAALDQIDDKLAARRAAASAASTAAPSSLDSYIGMLYPIESMRVYGYLTNSRIKLLAVIDDEEVKEAQMRAFFRRLHQVYVETVSNPFFDAGSALGGCAKFERQLERIVEAGLY